MVPDLLKTGTQISDLIRDINDSDAWYHHELKEIADLFEASSLCALRFLTFGTDCLVFELAEDCILKISPNGYLSNGRGWRPIDLPILCHGLQSRDTAIQNNLPIQWFVQPKAITPVADEQVHQFFDIAKAFGYGFNDPTPKNLGVYQGRVYLLDPWAAD